MLEVKWAEKSDLSSVEVKLKVMLLRLTWGSLTHYVNRELWSVFRERSLHGYSSSQSFDTTKRHHWSLERGGAQSL